MYYKHLFILSVLFVYINACRINLKVRSMTKKPFQIEVLMPSIGVHTERVLFKEERSEKKVKIEGKNCSGKHWTFRTFKQNASGDWTKAHEQTGRFDGQGEIIMQIGNDFFPSVASRSGVFCSETLLCG